jgi:serine-type D-Ala-D-Ala carboxypeptidase/endopeptidase (penicillin-binding protein 4)
MISFKQSYQHLAMKKVLILAAGCLLQVNYTYSQAVSQRLQKTFAVFEKDAQLKHAISSLYIIDAKTGQVVFDKNSQVGLAPASTQKIITSVTAFELLGKDYRYKTEFGIINERGRKNLYIKPSGDPTFGSWRWESTKEEAILESLSKTIPSGKFDGFTINTQGWQSHVIPDGWIWQDIGNYYGAASGFLNWRENQYDIIMKSGSSLGDDVKIVEIKPYLFGYHLVSLVLSAKEGTGDNAYIYFHPGTSLISIKGTIPVNENRFKISGSFPSSENQFISTLRKRLNNSVTDTNTLITGYTDSLTNNNVKIFYTTFSPAMDSIIYWFNKKSINLYGEALIKTIAHEKMRLAIADSGVAVVKKFWKENGLDEDELNIYDGSGLSPLNRVTTHAQVEILKYAKTKDWFSLFLKSLPEYNGITMKSGTISDVKGFCGYHKAKDGKEYIFSFLVNNYSGKSSQLVGKMYKVLDELK